MNKIVESLIVFIISYLFLFILYIFFFYKKGIKNNGILNSMQVEFVTKRFNLVKEHLNNKKIGMAICFIDPLIISSVGTIVSLLKFNYLFILLIGFVLLIVFIFLIYSIFGYFLKRKVNKNV